MSAVRSVSALVVALGVTAVLHAQTFTIKMATIVPANSTWHKALLEMGAAWSKATENRVALRVYEGGTQGDERSVIRMLRPGVDQMQSSLLTLPGLAEIDDAFNVFGMPFFFQTDEEATYVRNKLTPVFEKRLEAKGLKLLVWGNGGWVQLFSKTPIKTLDEVKKAKLYTSEGDDKMVNWYKNNGFNPVAIRSADIPGALKTGMINAVPMPPYPASVLQIFQDAKYMLDVRLAPLLGAIVITNTAWNRITVEDRAKLVEAAKAFEKQMDSAAPSQDAGAVTAMGKRGLTVTPLDAKARAEFQAAAEKLVASARGSMVPADVFNQAIQERDAFRKTKK
ncbi:MAG TPA: TRAP transporter substrate-binding protein DctP [Vicinamibacterales bacterium]|nr:TRAP transporter substrate-binding protein DctP [Vicinamibacterales bacterium]